MTLRRSLSPWSSIFPIFHLGEAWLNRIILGQDRMSRKKTSFLNLEKVRNLDCSFRWKNNVRNETLERSWLADICLRFMEKTVRVEVPPKKAEGQGTSIEAICLRAKGWGEISLRNNPWAENWEDSEERLQLVWPLDQGKRRPCPGSQAQRGPVLVSLGYTGQGVWEAQGYIHI